MNLRGGQVRLVSAIFWVCIPQGRPTPGSLILFGEWVFFIFSLVFSKCLGMNFWGGRVRQVSVTFWVCLPQGRPTGLGHTGYPCGPAWGAFRSYRLVVNDYFFNILLYKMTGGNMYYLSYVPLRMGGNISVHELWGGTSFQSWLSADLGLPVVCVCVFVCLCTCLR